MIFLIAEDNLRMRASIRNFLLTRIPGQHVICEASDGAEAVELYGRVRPDWVLMDVMMEPMDGLVASRQIIAAYPEASIIVLTNYDGDQYRRTASEAGVRGYVLKENLHEIRELVLQR